MSWPAACELCTCSMNSSGLLSRGMCSLGSCHLHRRVGGFQRRRVLGRSRHAGIGANAEPEAARARWRWRSRPSSRDLALRGAKAQRAAASALVTRRGAARAW
eukprot:366300-Chlamydomonas_euryale.AAC.6